MTRQAKFYEDLLKRFKWSHFVTLTTRYGLHEKSVRRLMADVARFLEAPTITQAFWVAEVFAKGDDYHIHLLLKCPNERLLVRFKDWYFKRYGLVTIAARFNSNYSYMVKALGNPNTDYDFLI